MSVGEILMGLAHSPRISTNGLVFAFDADNTKSYKGPAIQNMASTIVAQTYSGTGIVFTPSTESVFIPGIGQVTSPKLTGYNNYSSVSSDCCPQIYYYVVGNDYVNVSPSTTYTYAIVYKTTSGYTHPNFMYRYEYNSTTYVTEAGVHNDSNRIHLGDGWYWAWGTFTTSATTNRVYLRCFYYKYGTTNDNIYIAKVLVTPGTYTGLHPSRWPDVNTSKSVTDTFIDMTNNTTCSAALPAYNSNGSFSFDGTNNYIRYNNSTSLDTQTPTVEVWVKTNALSQNGFWFEKGAVNTQYSLFQQGGVIQWRQYFSSGQGVTNLSTTTATYLNTSNWFQIVGTFVSGSRILYINGVQVNSDTQAGTISTNSSGITIGEYGGGGYRYNGNIAIVRIYNRALSAAEVKQNFNALRGRFNI